jgi:hypothetical protein
MANTGYFWSAFSFIQDSAADIDTITVADTVGLVSDLTSIDEKASAIIGIKLVGASGTVDGLFVVTISRKSGAGSDFETFGFSWTIEPTSSATVQDTISISGADYDDFDVTLQNDSGISIDVSATIKTSSIPAAS